MGTLRYASKAFAKHTLPPEIMSVVDRMAKGIACPRITYRYEFLRSGEMFGHGRMHYDGREEEDEVHRLLTIGGVPTLGGDNQILRAGTVWEYSGRYLHQARPVEEDTMRLLIRVSRTSMLYRDHWQVPKLFRRKDSPVQETHP